MDRKETPQERVTRVSQELSTAIRQQVRGRFKQIRTADRQERGRHVWRFQVGPNSGSRFLHVEHVAMTQGENPTARLLQQLESARWLDRLQQGREPALILSKDGQLSPYAQD